MYFISLLYKTFCHGARYRHTNLGNKKLSFLPTNTTSYAVSLHPQSRFIGTLDISIARGNDKKLRGDRKVAAFSSLLSEIASSMSFLELSRKNKKMIQMIFKASIIPLALF